MKLAKPQLKQIIIEELKKVLLKEFGADRGGSVGLLTKWNVVGPSQFPNAVGSKGKRDREVYSSQPIFEKMLKEAQASTCEVLDTNLGYITFDEYGNKRRADSASEIYDRGYGSGASGGYYDVWVSRDCSRCQSRADQITSLQRSLMKEKYEPGRQAYFVLIIGSKMEGAGRKGGYKRGLGMAGSTPGEYGLPSMGSVFDIVPAAGAPMTPMTQAPEAEETEGL